MTSPPRWGETDSLSGDGRSRETTAERGSNAAFASETDKSAKAAAGTVAADPLDIAQAAKETAKAAVEAASTQAAEFIGHVGDELGQSAEKQKRQGADAIKGFARAIHRAGDEIDSQSPAISHQFHSVAQHVETLSDSIREKSVRDLFTSASNLARAQPAVFFAGAAVAGFALARFIKSSAMHPQDDVSQPNPSAMENEGRS